LAKYCRIIERLNGCLLQGQYRKIAFTATATSEPTHVEQLVASDQKMTGSSGATCGKQSKHDWTPVGKVWYNRCKTEWYLAIQGVGAQIRVQSAVNVITAGQFLVRKQLST
jgi:hypothetical protein